MASNTVRRLGLWNRSPPTGCLKTTEIQSLAALQASTLRSGCPEGCAPSEGSRGESCLSSSRVWGFHSGGCWHPRRPWLVDASLRPPACILTRPSSLCLSVASSVSYKDPHPGTHPDLVQTRPDPQSRLLRPSELRSHLRFWVDMNFGGTLFNPTQKES